MSKVFGAETTTDEVLDGLDLSSRRILVTGISAGLGVETARALAARGANVVGAARDLAKADQATKCVTEGAAYGGGLELVELDLADLASVHACADRLNAAGDPFDVLIANAGVMAVPQGRSVDGFETQFATNYLGHFVLANRVAGLLKPGGRLVMVSSAGHRGADVDLDDLAFQHTPYDPLVAYRRSKTATILFAVEFDRRRRERGVRATAVHPGAVLTDTTREMIKAQPAAASAFTWKTVEQGAATPVWAALIGPADEVGGRYCEDCNVADVVDDPSLSRGVRSYALDSERAKDLWRSSEKLVGETF